MKDDKIVSEVRRVRAKIFEECGGTLEGLYTHLKELEKKQKKRLVKSPVRPRPDRSKHVAPPEP